VPLRRGFKAEAERIAARLRAELGLRADQPLDPQSIAAHIGVEVRSAADLVDVDRLRRLEALQSDAFSACTFALASGRKVIVYNPLRSRGRQSSDVAHELAHLILGHELSRLERIGDMAFFVCDPTQEAEATWLAGCLLLPREQLLADLARGWSTSRIARRRRTSDDMVIYRINVTGVRRQLGSGARRG